MIEDYIRIIGDVTDPAPFEGVSGGGCTGTAEEPAPQPMTEIDEGLWTAQSAFVSGEKDYLAQLNNEWKNTQNLIESGRIESAFDFIGEYLEEGMSAGIFAILAKAGIVLSGGTAFVIGVIASVGVGYGVGKFKNFFINWLKEGNKLLEAMIGEDDALLLVSKSLENYHVRNKVIDRHERTMLRLLEELKGIEQSSKEMMGSLEGNDRIADVLEKSLLAQKLENGNPVTDSDGDPVLEGFLNDRLKDLAYVDVMQDNGNFAQYIKGRMTEY